MTNNITITGRLSADPELKFGQSGTAFCNISVPDQKRVKNKSTDQWEDASATTWFRATVFKEAAESLAESAHKGDTVIITGRLISREWEKDGQTRSSLEVDYATVAVVPAAPKADRGQSPEPAWGNQSQGDPWTTGTQHAKGGAGNDYDSPPF